MNSLTALEAKPCTPFPLITRGVPCIEDELCRLFGLSIDQGPEGNSKQKASTSYCLPLLRTKSWAVASSNDGASGSPPAWTEISRFFERLQCPPQVVGCPPLGRATLLCLFLRMEGDKTPSKAAPSPASTPNKGAAPSPAKNTPGRAAPGSAAPTKPSSILDYSKWVAVVRYVASLSKDCVVGKKSFGQRAASDPRDSVSKL
jgi:hypothetical protein